MERRQHYQAVLERRGFRSVSPTSRSGEGDGETVAADALDRQPSTPSHPNSARAQISPHGVNEPLQHAERHHSDLRRKKVLYRENGS